MKKAILGIKIGMTQIFDDNNSLIPVTVVKAGPCSVVQIKTNEKEGYNAIQVGFEKTTVKDGIYHRHGATKPIVCHFKKANVEPKKYLKEFRLDDISEFKIGDEIKADIFNIGDIVSVSAVSKGKGFQGMIKRYGRHRGPMSHGSKFHRFAGSSGSVDATRVFKGKRMAGHMGHVNTTIKNLKILRVNKEENIIFIKGSVPGCKKELVIIKHV